MDTLIRHNFSFIISRLLDLIIHSHNQFSMHTCSSHSQHRRHTNKCITNVSHNNISLDITKIHQSIQSNTSSSYYDYMQMIFVSLVSSRKPKKDFNLCTQAFPLPVLISKVKLPNRILDHSRMF